MIINDNHDHDVLFCTSKRDTYQLLLTLFSGLSYACRTEADNNLTL